MLHLVGLLVFVKEFLFFGKSLVVRLTLGHHHAVPGIRLQRCRTSLCNNGRLVYCSKESSFGVKKVRITMLKLVIPARFIGIRNLERGSGNSTTVAYFFSRELFNGHGG